MNPLLISAYVNEINQILASTEPTNTKPNVNLLLTNAYVHLDDINQGLASIEPKLSAKNIKTLYEIRELFRKICYIRANYLSEARYGSTFTDEARKKNMEDFDEKLASPAGRFKEVCYQTADLIARESSETLSSENRRLMAVDMQWIIVDMQRMMLYEANLHEPVTECDNHLRSVTECNLQRFIANTPSITEIEGILDNWSALEKRGKLNIDLINTTMFDQLLKAMDHNPECLSRVQGLRVNYVMLCFKSFTILYYKHANTIRMSEDLYKAYLSGFTRMCKDILSNEACILCIETLKRHDTRIRYQHRNGNESESINTCVQNIQYIMRLDIFT